MVPMEFAHCRVESASTTMAILGFEEAKKHRAVLSVLSREFRSKFTDEVVGSLSSLPGKVDRDSRSRRRHVQRPCSRVAGRGAMKELRCRRRVGRLDRVSQQQQFNMNKNVKSCLDRLRGIAEEHVVSWSKLRLSEGLERDGVCSAQGGVRFDHNGKFRQ